jgi:hypothetical protein
VLWLSTSTGPPSNLLRLYGAATAWIGRYSIFLQGLHNLGMLAILNLQSQAQCVRCGIRYPCLNTRVEFWKSVHQVGSCIRWGGTVLDQTSPGLAPGLTIEKHCLQATPLRPAKRIRPPQAYQAYQTPPRAYQLSLPR